MLKRNANLDSLRALAICMVTAYHIIQMSPVPLPTLMKVASAGQYGVDLFFVLSGWLIGGLFWKERSQFGDVWLQRFLLRRWWRTIPPYLAALALSFLAVRWQRQEPFDWGYLAFIQNYYLQIPFFLVSWSLCIEEHFYLVVPFVLIMFRSVVDKFPAAIALLALSAPICRWLESLDGVAPAFGYEHTATHLRLEGLLLGFWMAYLSNSDGRGWRVVRRLSPWIAAGAALALAGVSIAGGNAMYVAGLAILAVGWSALLALMVERPPGSLAAARLVKAIALASYSVYLTHPLMLHASITLTKMLPSACWYFYFPIAIALITAAGCIFYFGIERVAIQTRDRMVPRRATALSMQRP